MTTPNPLNLAADRLRGRWMQGHLGDIHGDGPVCATGAIHATITSRVQRRLAWSLLCEVITPHWKILQFNDTASTTEEDVLLAFKRASVLWDERYGGES